MKPHPPGPVPRRQGGGGVNPEHVRVLRAGHGANCSSIGSVIDTLFFTALAGGAIFAAVAAALATEPVRVVPVPPRGDPAPEPAKDEGEP